jgi:Cof subfamily protein (haloacid dehalogenase superfamily)
VSLNSPSSSTSPAIRLLLADVDGTLVTPDKALTEATIAAVRELHEAGILFALTSGRPPRGMSMLIEPLDVRTPIAAFNGGLLVDRDMSVIEQRTIPAELVPPTIELLEAHDLDVWLYQGAEWFVRDRNGPHVEREAQTVQFEPTVRTDYDGLVDRIAKIVGVSDDHDAVARAATAARERFGDHVSAARSQPYYVDVTHPRANKGSVVEYLSRRYDIPGEQIATIGDMPNDVLMFARSGLSIAMGNADREVQRAARRVTGSNEHDGFAEAVRRFVLPRAPGATSSAI